MMDTSLYRPTDEPCVRFDGNFKYDAPVNIPGQFYVELAGRMVDEARCALADAIEAFLSEAHQDEPRPNHVVIRACLIDPDDHEQLVAFGRKLRAIHG